MYGSVARYGPRVRRYSPTKRASCDELHRLVSRNNTPLRWWNSEKFSDERSSLRRFKRYSLPLERPTLLLIRQLPFFLPFLPPLHLSFLFIFFSVPCLVAITHGARERFRSTIVECLYDCTFYSFMARIRSSALRSEVSLAEVLPGVRFIGDRSPCLLIAVYLVRTTNFNAVQLFDRGFLCKFAFWECEKLFHTVEFWPDLLFMDLLCLKREISNY